MTAVTFWRIPIPLLLTVLALDVAGFVEAPADKLLVATDEVIE
jgi:hypothetical protein